MNYILILLIFFVLPSCNTSKKVFMCGERECVNKKEAEIYFSENFTIEVMVKERKKNKSFNLVKLNTNQVTKVKNNIKKKNEIIKISRSEKNKIIKEMIKKEKQKSIKKTKNEMVQLNEIKKKNIINKSIKKVEISDICSDIQDCDIDKISDHFIKLGKSKDFPNISVTK